MTREEQIKKVAEGKYVNTPMPYIRSSFIEGAKWADEHPKNPWISVKEQPKKTDVYYVRTRQGCADMAYFDSSIEKWEKGRFTDGTVTHWMPIPELKKGE